MGELDMMDLSEKDWEIILANDKLKNALLDTIKQIKNVLITSENMEEANLVFKNWKEFKSRGVI